MSWSSFWSEFSAVALVLWVVVAIATMYLLRSNAHRAIERISRGGFRWLRLFSRACAAVAGRIDSRNREAMLALQMEITRRQLEREFHRVAAAVEQDMTKFQHLERSVNEHINLMGEDFERSAQVPPAPPGWVEAVDAIAKLQAETNPEPVARVLQDIHNSVCDQQREVMREYRWAVNARHKILADLRPLWSRVSSQVTAVGRDSRDLLARSHRIDTHMAAFRELCANRADVRVESFLARWLMALALTAVALVLATLNSNLLAPPLAGLLGGEVVNAQTTAIAFTLAVMAIALVLSETTEVSRLLPFLGGLPRRSRIALIVVSTLLLLMLASGEALLLASSASGRAVGSVSLAVWGAASAGFVVPLLLALLSPALEALLATSRPVLGSAAVAVLTLIAFISRLLGRLWLELGRLLHQVYDMILFIPLSAEQAIAGRSDQSHGGSGEPVVPAAAAKVRKLGFGNGP